jgi:hypothetical protein
VETSTIVDHYYKAYSSGSKDEILTRCNLAEYFLQIGQPVAFAKNKVEPCWAICLDWFQ